MGKPTLDSIDHVAVAVDDIAKGVNWYHTRFQCEISYQDSTWALLRFANVRLALVIPEQHPPHVGFDSDEAESFGKLTRHRDGSKSVYVRDSSGNSVEILEPLRSDQ